MSEQQNKGICPPHNPTGEWSVRDGKSYATCKNCGEYETSLMEKDTSPITMEEKERVGFITGKLSFIKNTNVPIYKANINEEISKVILVNDLPSVISSAVSQALKEQIEDILAMQEIHMGDGGWVYQGDIKKYAISKGLLSNNKE